MAMTLKCPQIQSQSIYFSNFSLKGMPSDPLALAYYTHADLHNNDHPIHAGRSAAGWPDR